MEPLKSFREYITRLQALGEIQEIDAEVDWHLEMGAIIRRTYELKAPAPLFNRIKGIEAGFRVLGAPAGLSRTRGLVRIAVSLGLPESTSARDIIEALVAAHARPGIPPRRVPSGACQEHAMLGADVDLFRLPAPYIHDGDGGRYLNTWGTIVVKTPDGSWTNWSITRVMIAGKNTMLGAVIPGQHLGMIFQMWKKLGQPMPFALAQGTPPAIPFVSGMPLDDHVNEADFVGGFQGEPVDVVRCRTVDLDVPATSEIVIEGTVAIDESKWEGPMGEYSGYLSPQGGMPSPVFKVSAITHRERPILPVVAAGEPTEENHTCWGLTVSAQLLWELRQAGFPATTCFAPFESAAHWLAVTVPASITPSPSGRAFGGEGVVAWSQTMPQQADGDKLARELGRLLFRSRSGSFIPKVILLGDDIDPANLAELVWAFATRNHPERGCVLFPDEKVLPLVAFLTAEERKAARGVKVIYNCLPAADCPPEQTPKRSSFRFLWPKEIQEKVLANWQRYGFAGE